MAYTINLSDGTALVTISDGALDNTTSLTLPGANAIGYGELLNENLVHLLENFAGNTVPSGTPLQGQLYFDKFNQILKVYTTQGYVPVSGVTNAGIQPAISKDGDLWFNTSTNQMSIWDNGQFKLIGPTYTKAQGVSGAVPTTVNDGSTSGLTHDIIKIQFGNVIIATFNADAEFTPAGFDPGFPRINGGLTINSNIANSRINTNVTGNVTGNLTGNVVGNVIATQLTGTLTGNVVATTLVGQLTGNVTGDLTGNVVARTIQTTNFNSGNVSINGGNLTGLTKVEASTSYAVNFSTANAQITGGNVTGVTNLTTTTLQATNFSTGNAQISGGTITGLTNLTSTNQTATNLESTSLQATNFSTGNAQISGGSITGILNATTTNGVVTNFSTGNALITGGSLTGILNATATNGAITNFSTGNALITGGNISGIVGTNNTFTAVSLQSSTANTPNISVQTTALATTAYVHNVMPIGAIIMYSGNTIPYGWQICNGSNGTPDLRDRFIVGAGTAYVPGASGGNNSVTLTSGQIPSHSHTISGSGTTSTAGSHNHTASSTSSTVISDPSHAHTYTASNDNNVPTYYNGGSSKMYVNSGTYAAGTAGAFTGVTASTSTSTSVAGVGDHAHTFSFSGTSGSTGGTTAVDIRPRYYALYYIQKVI